ncbi:UNVERIFIED_CONTAM: DNA (cytosine-5)-methyltransferase CMT2 [Sesamum indicum]
MGSSETGGGGGGGGGVVDCSVGSIVWVRRRNGSWWPGKILGPEELSSSHITSPRSGTPVKLLGREDASVLQMMRNGTRRHTEKPLKLSFKIISEQLNLVPDYAINFRDGKSTKPFGRLWWDETVPTVFCFPDPHMRAVLHPEQDRLLTLRECARLQGFHDYYKFCGKLKERYSQVGNAVAVSVGRALGYSLGMAVQKLSGGDEHLMTLPPNFSHSTTTQLQSLLIKSEQ